LRVRREHNFARLLGNDDVRSGRRLRPAKLEQECEYDNLVLSPPRASFASFTKSIARRCAPATLSLMPPTRWREEVAALLADAAQALIARQDRQVVAKLGTALAYLEKAELSSQPGARELLTKVRSMAPEQETERFRFTTDELEEIKRRVKGE